MCRWFGYRPRYTDLCKVYLPFESDEWYSFITTSINELYSELDLMSRSEKRPREFGLKVREHPGSMIITARNKAQASSSEVRSQDLWGQILRRFRFRKTVESNRKNLEYTERLLERLKEEIPENEQIIDKDSGSLIFENVDYSEIIDFIQEIDLPEDDIGNRALIKQLREMQKSNLPSPKICFYNQFKSRPPWWTENLPEDDRTFAVQQYSLGGTKFSMPIRRLRDTGLTFSSRSTQLGNPDDEKLLLNKAERDIIASTNSKSTSFDYIAHPSRDFPALIIYLFCTGTTIPADAKKGSRYEASLCLGQTPALGYSVSIPRPESLRGLSQNELKRLIKDTKHSYLVNKVYSDQLEAIDIFEEEDDE